MKKEYPQYVKNQLETIFNKLSKDEKQTINDFIAYCAISAGQRKLGDIKRSIVQFRDIVNIQFDKMTLKDLRDYLALLNQSGRTKYTTNGIKLHLKRFLKWKFKDWSERFEGLKDIKLASNPFNDQKINEGTLLKKEDIERMMQKESDPIRKAFFITLYESGCRPQELREIKWKDINFNVDGEISEVYVYSKKISKARSVFIKDATFWLKQLREETKGEYVFYSRESKNMPIDKSTATRWIQDIGKRLDKKIFPYLLRHSRANELYTKMPEKISQKFLGHKKSMSDLYSHVSSKDVKEAMGKIIYNTELTPEQKNKYDLELDRMKKENEEIKKMGFIQNKFMQLSMQLQAEQITHLQYREEIARLHKLSAKIWNLPEIKAKLQSR